MTYSPSSPEPEPQFRRKLRPLVITMGSDRQEHIRELFSQPIMAQHFEPPTFSPGIPSRSLRSRWSFLQNAYRAGLIPEAEYQALRAAHDENPQYGLKNPNRFFDCFEHVPVTSGRRGSEYDTSLHYSVEFWQKSKGLNRGRAVLACTLAHLIAMQTCVQEGYDFILEDNVRAAPQDCARRIWQAKLASDDWEKEHDSSCHLRYYGWLGSIPNVQWVLESHANQTKFERPDQDENDATVFPFPLAQDIPASSTTAEEEDEESSDQVVSNNDVSIAQKPGGTPIWGAYAYWISGEGLECLLSTLRNDVGAMLWRGKRMRCYSVKPIDKILPRQIMTTLGKGGRDCIHVSSHPAFFRAPMLTSKIHSNGMPPFVKAQSSK